jgi:MSHA biogenesis protein MshJ
MNLYQHSVEITLQGEYLDLRDYVERVQSLPFEYYWEGLRYDVQDYPTAQLTVTLYALSTSKELIGG